MDKHYTHLAAEERSGISSESRRHVQTRTDASSACYDASVAAQAH